MSGLVNFMRSVVFMAMCLAAAGTLAESTGCMGREAVKAHQTGGISFRWLNNQLNR